MYRPYTLEGLKAALPQIKAWLEASGAVLEDSKSLWEPLRFKAAGVTGIVYTTAKGKLTYTGAADEALKAWAEGKPWTPKPLARLTSCQRRARARAALVESLKQRDGEDCFLCHKPLGDDISLEHLLALSNGGNSEMYNLALAHKACNSELGHLPIMSKIKARESRLNETDNRRT